MKTGDLAHAKLFGYLTSACSFAELWSLTRCKNRQLGPLNATRASASIANNLKKVGKVMSRGSFTMAPCRFLGFKASPLRASGFRFIDRLEQRGGQFARQDAWNDLAKHRKALAQHQSFFLLLSLSRLMMSGVTASTTLTAVLTP